MFSILDVQDRRELPTKASVTLPNNTDLEIQFQVDRTMPITIGHQLKGQIVHAISRGLLRPGDQLPSLRDLTVALGISYATAANLYSELAQEGLLVTRPGKGTFVADLTRAEWVRQRQSSQISLQQLVAKLLSQAFAMGHNPNEIVRAVHDAIEAYNLNSPVRYAMVVGYAPNATESYARDLERMLSGPDFRVSVQPILLEDLRTDCVHALSSLHPATLVITPPHALREVRDLLEPLGFHVASAAFELCAETRRRLASIKPEARVGIIATEIEYVPTLLGGVASYIPPSSTILKAVRDQVPEIKKLLSNIDVLVYHTGCETILEWLPAHVEAIEYLHSPEPDSVARLRPLLLE